MKNYATCKSVLEWAYFVLFRLWLSVSTLSPTSQRASEIAATVCPNHTGPASCRNRKGASWPWGVCPFIATTVSWAVYRLWGAVLDLSFKAFISTPGGKVSFSLLDREFRQPRKEKGCHLNPVPSQNSKYSNLASLLDSLWPASVPNWQNCPLLHPRKNTNKCYCLQVNLVLNTLSEMD